MNTFRILSIAAAMALVVGMSFADDELGKKPKPKPPTNGGGSGGGGGNPPNQKPPENKPPQNKPPENKPPQNRPPENKPPTQGGGGNGGGSGSGDSGLGKPKPGNGNGGGNGGGSNGGGSTSGGNNSGGNRPPVVIGGGNGGNQGGNNNGNQGNNGLGRIDNNNGRRPGQGNDNDLGRSNRKDKIYNSVNNVNRGERNSSPFRIGNAPVDVFSGSLSNQVLREDKVRARYPEDSRRGYYSYHNGWCDDDFWYSHYVFVPNNRCIVSPWYYYSHIPGYIQLNSIMILSGDRSYNWRGSYYSYRPLVFNGGSWFNDNRSDVDYAIDDLVSMFERRDRRALSRLLPRNGEIDIYFDRRYSYSLETDEFYDLMLDGIMTTRTRRYEIVRVERNRNEIEIQARHDYVDPWGFNTSVYHWYRLEWERDGYVITKFGTTNRSAW